MDTFVYSGGSRIFPRGAPTPKVGVGTVPLRSATDIKQLFANVTQRGRPFPDAITLWLMFQEAEEDIHYSSVRFRKFISNYNASHKKGIF